MPGDKKVCQGVDMEVRQSSRLKGVKRFTSVPFYFLFQIFYCWYYMYKGHGWIQLSSGLADVLWACDDFAHLSVYAFDLRSTSLPTSFHADFTSHLIGSYSRRGKKQNWNWKLAAGRDAVGIRGKSFFLFLFRLFLFRLFPSLILSCVIAVKKYNNKFLLFSCDVFLDTFCF